MRQTHNGRLHNPPCTTSSYAPDHPGPCCTCNGMSRNFDCEFGRWVNAGRPGKVLLNLSSFDCPLCGAKTFWESYVGPVAIQPTTAVCVHCSPDWCGHTDSWDSTSHVPGEWAIPSVETHVCLRPLPCGTHDGRCRSVRSTPGRLLLCAYSSDHPHTRHLAHDASGDTWLDDAEVEPRQVPRVNGKIEVRAQRAIEA